MGVFTRTDSPWLWLWLETAPPGQQREKTKFKIGTTAAQRLDNRRAAEELYHERMSEIAKRIHRFPAAPATAMTFEAFAPWYDTNHIAHHGGHERERGILKRLRAVFGSYALDAITKDLVIAWRTTRRAAGVTVERFGARAGHVPMWARIHAFLIARGPTPLADIKAEFKLTSRNVSRSYLTPQTAQYFAREDRGVWSAVGTPPHARRHTYAPPSARTVNREVDLLQQMLSAAVEAGYIDKSPIYGLANLPIVEPIRRTMSETEERAVLRELAPDDRALMLVGLDTLTRMIDILDLEWADDHGTMLDIIDPKNGTSHTVPISTRTRKALDALPKTGKFIFPKRRRARTAGARRSVVAKALQRACRRADVPYGRALRGLTFHWSTRRTGATRMIRRGGEKAIGVVQQIGGWKDPSVLIGIYQETITPEMVAAVETVAPKNQSATYGLLSKRKRRLKLLRKRA